MNVDYTMVWLAKSVTEVNLPKPQFTIFGKGTQRVMVLKLGETRKFIYSMYPRKVDTVPVLPVTVSKGC